MFWCDYTDRSIAVFRRKIKYDYRGFDRDGIDGIKEAWEWSRQRLNTLEPTVEVGGGFAPRGSADGTNIDAWNRQLDYFGLPRDETGRRMSVAQNAEPTTPEQRRANLMGDDTRYSLEVDIGDSKVYNRTVVLKEDTVDKYLKDYASKGTPKYAQAYIAYMSPDTFLKLTTTPAGRGQVSRETGPLDLENLKSATVEQPFQLRIDHESGEVSGHEGRHRATALYRANIDKIPVLLFDSSNKYSKVPIENLKLTGQFDDRASATVTDVEPLSYGNRDAVLQKFATQPVLERMQEKYNGRETVRYSLAQDTEPTTPEQRRDNLMGDVVGRMVGQQKGENERYSITNNSNPDLQKRIDTAIQMLDNGATPSEVYGATKLFYSNNGDLREDLFGEPVWRYQNSDAMDERGLLAARQVAEPREVYGQTDRRALAGSAGQERNPTRRAWENLRPKARQAIIDAATRHILQDEDESTIALQLYNAYPTSQAFAKDFYNSYRKGDAVVENWLKDFPDVDGLIREIDQILQDEEKNEKTNRRLSLATTTDTDGVVLSPEQQEYFKDSVVRDADGRLKVMYHGTSNAGFTKFDPYFSKFGLFGNGFYFTDNPEIAESYTKKGDGTNPGVYEVYLNARNLIDMDGEADLDYWRNKLQELYDSDYYDVSEPDYYLQGVRTNEDVFRALEEFVSDAGMYKYDGEDFMQDILREAGYDGITHRGGGRYGAKDGPRHQVVIVFDPEQAKRTDNLNPTTNPDMRYSISQNQQMTREQQIQDIVQRMMAQDPTIHTDWNDTARREERMRISRQQINNVSDHRANRRAINLPSTDSNRKVIMRAAQTLAEARKYCEKEKEKDKK